MIDADRLREFVRLHRLRCSARQIARVLRMGPNTQRRYRNTLASVALLDGPADDLPHLEALRAVIAPTRPPRRPQHTSSVEPWRERVKALLHKGLTPRAVFDRLRLEGHDAHPFPASYSSVKRFCRQVLRERGPCAADVVIPVESRPGECGQVDFGYAGRFYDPNRGVLRRAWLFVLVLAYSRLAFMRLVFDQRVETWLQLHVQAFAELGGVPRTIVPDRLRRAVTRGAFGADGTTELNRSYRELARHYGFVVDPCPPRAPRKKGKVEAALKYALRSALAGRDGEAFDQVQVALVRWNREIASTRLHGTTRRRPIDVFEQEERAALRPLPATAYELTVWKQARVHPDSHVAYRRRLYSVPWSLIHRDVWIRATPAVVEVLHEDRVVARHDARGSARSTIEEHLPADRRDLRQRGREFWEIRAAHVGPETLSFVREVFDSDLALSQLRRVQAIVTYLERHPPARAEATCHRARRLRDFSYHGIKRTLTSALDSHEPHTS